MTARWLGSLLPAIASVFMSTGGAQAQTVSVAAPVTAKATFAGGCFWCVESDFDKIPGVLSTTSGYIGGTVVNPTYQQVSGKGTGHAEAVEIVFDPAKVSYTTLVEKFWRTIDPTTKDRQFCDAGNPYRTAIFTHDAAQAEVVKRSLAALEKSKPFKEPIVTEVVAATRFYAAEDYHQDYYLKNPIRYKYYRTSCGRDARLQQLWGPTKN
ncbi:peptide-methionine (S)-S-oxide reductase MsrA [Hydrogenophaga sp.]|uniref:peptide-methionine (S)-S-oxide reductase MsrA n=1 Tax=Hydrogenophaga sp. TaxID=1904254 RepID=UPI0027319DC3|nr:peptide-methionine (S)-S-oxide reductase MsrA [Hydrogenophaga sp.]MDP2019226.1 peptide-methionine (S)-S-oxide reductase MsrA [Hydrogenophaga sp.]MDP3167954.1 peptide-methionine (S)-S-oxide reductase MsrA [Hydrogenophaga sp.]MDP3809623.1 peptide-methionine (S)-S-oxide reductase MsrA [Hydrogenophaga sp.]